MSEGESVDLGCARPRDWRCDEIETGLAGLPGQSSKQTLPPLLTTTTTRYQP
ncbi:hypothetical protein M378DRAFT_160143 [Amanita muscaria Koide BX008]|uniref:Uncharacterized protein n=1 Tax=Amanita muscaria (strain Koide BX008) TaxID=946122 RepID=A0A0C2TJH0_AMAMK|nr:hypothetical protein M378DRAFT_160143 [Amanita muscaria Koide BX008]